MKYTYDQVKNDFEKRGYQLLTSQEEYHNVNQKLKYICPIHGEREISYAHLREGKGCSICGRENTKNASLKPDSYYKELAESKNFEFVQTYINDKGQRYIEFICPKHSEYGIQKVQVSNLKRNNGCKYCAGNVKKHLLNFKNN